MECTMVLTGVAIKHPRWRLPDSIRSEDVYESFRAGRRNVDDGVGDVEEVVD